MSEHRAHRSDDSNFVDRPEPLTLSIKAACHVSGLSPATLHRKILEGSLPSIKVGKRRLVMKADLQDWLTSHRTIAAKAA